MKNEFIKTNILENTKNYEYKKNNFNYGLSILKTILSFLVVIVHNFNWRSTKNKYILFITMNRHFHVPSFFILSFYFIEKLLTSLNVKLIIKRLLRLFIPYIAWPIIIWNINRFLVKIYHKKFPCSFELLKSQLIWGTRFMNQLWFNWNSILGIFLFVLIIFIFKKHFIFILQIMLILTYIVQYSGFNYKYIFLGCPFHYRYNIGFIFDSIPCEITGFFLSFYKLFNVAKSQRIKTVIFSLLIYYLISNFEVFSKRKGTPYQGINLNIQSICLILIFTVLPFDKIEKKYILKLIKIINNYSAGVFYLHVSIRFYFADIFDDIKKGTFFGIIITYIICYFISYIGTMLFGKTLFRHLFI